VHFNSSEQEMLDNLIMVIHQIHGFMPASTDP
jgi:hypothetical protein